jgi:hypothetical protein
MSRAGKMKHRIVAAVGACLLVLVGYSARSAQDGANPGLQILDFKPVMSDLMNMLIQPRHIKLYYAGQEDNWMLARFELNELRSAFVRTGDTIPQYGIFPFANSVEAVILEPLDGVQAAIDAEDHAEFERAYVELTAACNACHDAMHFEFIEITVPDLNSPRNFPDQIFAP